MRHHTPWILILAAVAWLVPGAFAASIPGTLRVLAPIAPSGTTDTYPTHMAAYGKGGLRTVANLAERDAIPAARREAGMLVWVDSEGVFYRLASNLADWIPFIGSSEPLMRSVAATQIFSRPSASIDPVTGEYASAEQPSIRRLLVSAAATVSTNSQWRVLGSLNQTLFGTPNTTNQTELWKSTDYGRTWAYVTNWGTGPSYSIERVIGFQTQAGSFAFASVASTTTTFLYYSTNFFTTCSDVIPPKVSLWTVGRVRFDTIEVEQRHGVPELSCKLLVSFYSGRTSRLNYRVNGIKVYRTTRTLGEMSLGQIPELRLAWAQDVADFWARYSPGAVVVSNKVGTVSATSTTLADSGNPFGASNSHTNRYVRIVSGTGSGQQRAITANTSGQLTVADAWVSIPDSTSDFQVIEAPSSELQGMHLHDIEWIPLEPGGATNVLFVSIGDGPPSRHVCRIPDFAALADIPDASDVLGQGHNYSDSHVWTREKQPTSIVIGSSTNVIEAAPDNTGAIIASLGAGGSINEEPIEWESANWQSLTNNAWGMIYDGVLTPGGDLISCSLSIGSPGASTVMLTRPGATNQSMRLWAGSEASNGGPRRVFRSDDGSFWVGAAGNEAPRETLQVRIGEPQVLNGVLVAGSGSLGVPNPRFTIVNGDVPTNYSKVSPGSAVFSVGSTGGAFGGGNYASISKTDGSQPGLGPTASTSLLLPVTEGQQVSADVWVRLPEATVVTNYLTSPVVELLLNWYSSGLGYLSGSSLGQVTSPPRDRWVRIHGGPATAPASAAYAGLYWRLRDQVNGAVHFAAPNLWIGTNRNQLPLAENRSADSFAVTNALSEYASASRVRSQIWVQPLWPHNFAGMESSERVLATSQSHQGGRWEVVWSQASGFTWRVMNSSGAVLHQAALGQIQFTRQDTIGVRVEWDGSNASCVVSVPWRSLRSDVGLGATMSRFDPALTRLGGDLFGSKVPLDGYYWHAVQVL